MSEETAPLVETTDATDLELVPERRVELTKVKLDKFNQLYVEYALTLNGVRSENTSKYYLTAHEDLVKAFQKLTVHLCLMTEVVNGLVCDGGEYRRYEQLDTLFIDDEIYRKPEFDSYRCTGFTLGSNDGVTLVGQKKLRSKKVLNLVAPYEVLEPDPPTGDEYLYLFYLDADLGTAIREAELYLEGKCNSDGHQLDMFEEVPEVGSPETKALAKEVNKFTHFMDEVAAKSGMTVTVSSSIDGHTHKRTFNGKELDSE